MSTSIAEMGSSIVDSLLCIMEARAIEKKFSKQKNKEFCAYHLTSFSNRIKRRFPIIEWLKNYTIRDLLRDGIGGIILGFTIIPQSIVFASVANVPFQYGLYSSIIGNFLYCVFGTVRELNIGPSAVMGLLIADYSLKGGAAYTVLLCFLSGCIELLFSILNLGFLIDFISAPVSCGFSSAAALMITVTQLRTVLGIKVKVKGFFDGLHQIYLHLNDINLWDCLVGGCCIALLLLLRCLNTIEWMDAGPYPTIKQRITRCLVRLISTGRNILIVAGSAGIAYYLSTQHVEVLSLTDKVEEGLPIIHSLPLSVVKGNHTASFLDMCQDLGPGIFLVPVLSILQHIVVAKFFHRGKIVDTTQELLALGLTNVLGAFISALPTSANLPRSCLNATNGVSSPLHGVFAGGVVLIASQFLTPYFHYIPQSALASVVICAVMFMFKFGIFLHLWKTNKIDFLVLMITFVGCIVLGAEYGILVGIGLSVVVLLYNTARPNISVQISYKPAFILVQPDRMLSFPAVEYVRYKVSKVADERKKFPIVFDGSHLCGMDYTVAQCVKEIIEEFQNRQQLLLFTNLQNSVTQLIQGMQPINFIYYPTIADAQIALSGDAKRKKNGIRVDLNWS